jgi:xylan 1,4-beta-xylosidase
MSYPARNSHPAFHAAASSSRPPLSDIQPPSARDCPINSFHIYDLHIAHLLSMLCGIFRAYLYDSKYMRGRGEGVPSSSSRLRRIGTSAMIRLAIFVGLFSLPISLVAQTAPATVTIDASAPGTAFPHFWEQMFGSGRAVLALRAAYRSDLREVKQATDFRYVRGHAILHDEVGVYDEDKQGKPIYNFTYVDQIYDGILANGVRPMVEISFMPRKLASDPNATHPFWYKQNVSPPKDYAKWDDLIRHFAQHLVERYGIGEVSQWYFEVWNEPNIDFWAGNPKQATYFELYDHTARALKSVSPLLRVGGPATAAADWIEPFLAHVSQQNVPIDFVSSHGYGDDTVENLFHTSEQIPMNQRVCRAIGKVHDQIKASGRPQLPLFWTEWSVPSYNDLGARDSTYVGPALAYDIVQCDGLVQMMSYWTFDDVFEEGGVSDGPFHNTFGLIAVGGIKKPAFYDYALMHRLGDERLANQSSNVLVTRRSDGSIVVATWNLVEPDQKGTAQHMRLEFRNVNAAAPVLVRRVDEKHSNSLAAYRAMGSPRYPTQAQIDQLNRESALAPAEVTTLKNGVLELDVPADGLALLEIQRW